MFALYHQHLVHVRSIYISRRSSKHASVMDRLLDAQTLVSLGYVVSMVTGAYLVSRSLLPPTTTLKTRSIFVWLAFDCICHLSLEASWLYLSTQRRSVNASTSFFGRLWQEYAKADARWGTGDATLVAMEFVTVLLCGPLAGYCAWLLSEGDRVYHFWVLVLSTAELYGGWMTFAPEWLVGSGALRTDDWLLCWVYLVVMNLVGVVVPAGLMWDSWQVVQSCLRQSKDGTVVERGKVRTKGVGLSGSAYLLLVAVVFVYIMPSTAASATYGPNAGTTVFPSASATEAVFSTVRAFLTPLLLPLGLILFSFTVGALQVVDKALRRVRKTNRTRRRKLLSTLNIDEKLSPPRTILGFFHPYCNAGGGGERVLYEAISLHLAADPRVVVVVYTGDFPAASKDEILAKASARFGIEIDANRVAMVGLRRRWMVQDSTWKSFTLLGQSYGSTWLAFEAMSSLIPDAYIDTMGYAFTFPICRLFAYRLPIGAYVHYPVISTDMLARVSGRQAGHTNASATAASWWRSAVKLGYYRLFARAYAWSLRRADVVVANGSWTQAHLTALMQRQVAKVFPPCDTDELARLDLDREQRLVVSLAQFRPEKEHPMQLRILARLRTTHPRLFQGPNAVKLIMMGSSRNADDEARIGLLRSLCAELQLQGHVEFLINADYATICAHLARASVGISTMKDEHFGINLVEFMAAGLVTVSHKSAGPWLDIAVPSKNWPLSGQGERERPVGYHAESVDEFAAVLAEVFEAQEGQEAEEVREMRSGARQRAQRVFGRQAFVEAWQNELWRKLEGKLQQKMVPQVEQHDKKSQ